LGETVEVSFSLPAPPPAPSPPENPEPRSPHGIILSGSLAAAVGVVRIARDDDEVDRPFPGPCGPWRVREAEWEGCDFVLHGLCVDGFAAVGPDTLRRQLDVSAPDAYRRSLGGTAVVTPIEPGARVDPQPPGPDGWTFLAQLATGSEAGFCVFVTPTDGFPPGATVTLGLSVDGGESW